jgi:hypothetical protein
MSAEVSDEMKEYYEFKHVEFRKIRDPYNRDVLPLIKAYKSQYKEYLDKCNAKYYELFPEENKL